MQSNSRIKTAETIAWGDLWDTRVKRSRLPRTLFIGVITRQVHVGLRRWWSGSHSDRDCCHCAYVSVGFVVDLVTRVTAPFLTVLFFPLHSQHISVFLMPRRQPVYTGAKVFPIYHGQLVAWRSSLICVPRAPRSAFSESCTFSGTPKNWAATRWLGHSISGYTIVRLGSITATNKNFSVSFVAVFVVARYQ